MQCSMKTAGLTCLRIYLQVFILNNFKQPTIQWFQLSFWYLYIALNDFLFRKLMSFYLVVCQRKMNLMFWQNLMKYLRYLMFFIVFFISIIQCYPINNSIKCKTYQFGVLCLFMTFNRPVLRLDDEPTLGIRGRWYQVFFVLVEKKNMPWLYQ